MRVGREVASGACEPQKVEQDFSMMITGVQRRYLRPASQEDAISQASAIGSGLVAIEGAGGEAQESENHYPGQEDRTASRQAGLPPDARGRVSHGARVVGVDQNVEVGEDHFPSLRVSSRAANSSASEFILSKSILGSKPNS